MAAPHPIDLSAGKILHEIPFFIRVYENGKVERFSGTEIIPAGVDPSTGAQSKDVVISPETNVAARIYIPKTAADNHQKLPVLIYFHGGGFVIESPYSPLYHSFHNLLVPEANVVAVSVDYRLAPQPPFPTQYDDCWEAVKWVASHAGRAGPEPWLNDHADLDNVVFAGDSAGGNIAHQMALRVGLGRVGGTGLSLRGMVLLHPFFWGEERIGQEEGHQFLGSARGILDLVYPDRKDLDDPYINPCADPNLGKLGAPKVLVFVAGQDLLWKRGEYYKQGLCESGWKGEIEVVEAVEENHVYFLFFPESENTVELRAKMCKFIKECTSKSNP